MKQNADLLSGNVDGGLRKLFDIFQNATIPGNRAVRIHLVGHSAGAIVHTHLADRLIGAKQSIESVVFMAPAVRSDTFVQKMKPHIGKNIRRFAGYHLDRKTEERDPTCRALLRYGDSVYPDRHTVAGARNGVGASAYVS